MFMQHDQHVGIDIEVGSATTPHWDAAAGQWTQHIGYHVTDDGNGSRRIRTRFRFGDDQRRATSESLSKQQEWDDLKKRWPTIRSTMERAASAIDWSKPVWLEHSQTRAAIDRQFKDGYLLRGTSCHLHQEKQRVPS